MSKKANMNNTIYEFAKKSEPECGPAEKKKERKIIRSLSFFVEIEGKLRARLWSADRIGPKKLVRYTGDYKRVDGRDRFGPGWSAVLAPQWSRMAPNLVTLEPWRKNENSCSKKNKEATKGKDRESSANLNDSVDAFKTADPDVKQPKTCLSLPLSPLPFCRVNVKKTVKEEGEDINKNIWPGRFENKVSYTWRTSEGKEERRKEQRRHQNIWRKKERKEEGEEGGGEWDSERLDTADDGRAASVARWAHFHYMEAPIWSSN